MTFTAGEVVILKSGGIPMTVILVDDEEAVCIWTGDDGDLFRETIPMIALQIADLSESDEDDEETGEDETVAEQETPAEDKASAA